MKNNIKLILGISICVIWILFIVYHLPVGTTYDVEQEATIVEVIHKSNGNCYNNASRHIITGDSKQVHEVVFKLSNGKRIKKKCGILDSDLFNIANRNVGRKVYVKGFYIHKIIFPKEYIVTDIEEVLYY